MSEFQSRRELREAERQGLVAKPEQVFDLPTGSIRLPEASEMLTRKRIREMERQGLLDPLTGSVAVSGASEPSEVDSRTYDEVLAETEEPITSSITAVVQDAPAPQTPIAHTPVEPTDFFHNLAVDPSARKPRVWLVVSVILLVLGGAGAAAYMLGIFK